MLNRRDFLKNALVLGAGLTVNLPLPVTSGVVPKERGKYGFINKRGDIIMRPQLDAVFPFHGGLAKVTIDGKCGFVDRNGKLAIKPWLDAEENFFRIFSDSDSDGLIQVSVDGKFGYMDRSGKLIVPNIYDDATAFYDAMAFVQQESVSGFIDKTGKMIVSNNSYEIYKNRFRKGLCCVSIDGKHGSINRDGKIVIPFISETALFFVEGTSPVKINGKWGYLDIKGIFTIKPVFDDAGFFSEGLASVKVGEKWGYIDKEGRVVLSDRFDEAYSFEGGRAMVKKDSEYLFINEMGEVVFRYGDTTPFCYGEFLLPQEELQPAWNANGNLFLIDAKGEEIIHLEDFYPLKNGFCTVKTNGRWGLMDNKGNTIIKPDFIDYLSFEEGLAGVETESGKYGFIDMKGRFVIRPQFTDAAAFSEGLAAVRF